MRRLNYLLLASGLQLGLAGARHHAFSVHEDLLAHPQFEIVFSETYIREADAHALLEDTAKRTASATNAEPSSSTTNDASSGTAVSSSASTDASTDEDEDFPVISETYEVINVPPSRYICAIPIVAAPKALNKTATDLAKAEEAREATRAAAHGWEIMSGLNDQCLYYTMGWWSYRFCYDREIVQYHALPAGPKSGPPVRDERTPEYVLGRSVAAYAHNSRSAKKLGDGDHREQAVLKQEDGAAEFQPPPNTELAIKGDQTYLVQRMDSGTICDLTGRPRTIEIQYHCVPGSTGDRIGWIKEITTCTYSMMVQTSRLCEDVAFVPPKPVRAHPISCRQIVGSEEEVQRWYRQKTLDAKIALAGGSTTGEVGKQEANKGRQNPKDQARSHVGVNIGGVIIGGRKVSAIAAKDGHPAPNLALRHGRGASGSFYNGAAAAPAAQSYVEVLAMAKSKAQGGTIEVVIDEDLESMDLDPEQIEELREQLITLAGDNAWRLELVENAGDLGVLRGVVEDPDKGDIYYAGGIAKSNAQGTGGGQAAAGEDADDRRAVGNRDKDKSGKAAAPGRRAQKEEAGGGRGEETGSEEKFFANARDEM